MNKATPAGITRRVVTGLDAAGRSCFTHDDAVPHAIPAVGLAWATASVPADNAAPCPPPPVDTIGPMHAGGTLFLLVRMPPGIYAAMHATDTIDYLTIISGEITLITETGEKVLRPGDVCVDRGIIHAWRNDGAVEAVYTCVTIPAHPVGAGRQDAEIA
ncbi:MAG TPA: cupin domain-containing protein [Novosphingobium sp.]|nr:cupin domain-containing protein [Novosphingobium sp.]